MEDKNLILHSMVLIFALIACFGCGKSPKPPTPPTSEIRLQSPSNGVSIDEVRPVLQWTGAQPPYTLTLVELGPTQNPARALQDNAPIIRQIVSGPTFAFPASRDSLRPGRGYAWQVSAIISGNVVVSDPAYFRVRYQGQTISRADAISIVIHRYIVPPTREWPVTAFLGRTLLNPGDAVWTDIDSTFRREIASPTWFSWINDDPQAFFSHPTRYLFIDATTGQTEVRPADWWPVLNGTPLWMSDEEWTDEALVIYSEVHIEEVK